MPARQFRWWIATIPREDWTPALPPGCDYLRGQPELGEGGFSHWQVVCHWGRKSTLTSVKRSFCSTAHLEPTRSSAALAYVWKEESRDGEPFEFGTKPLDRTSSADWDAIWDSATRGDLLSIPSDVRVRCYTTLRKISCDFAQPIGGIRTAICFWGRTGSGKSRRAFMEAGNEAYFKDPRSKFWCGYSGQESVIIDEFRGAIDIAHILRWLDRYPVMVETKGSAVPLRATKFWFTSNVHPRYWFQELDTPTYEALERRLEIVEIN